MREEFDLMGEDFVGCGARADETIEVMRNLFTAGMVSYEGRFYRLNMRQELSGPVQLVVGGSPRRD